MARLQITDLNSSDSKLMEELTDEELLEINGGGGFTWRGFNRWINDALGVVGAVGVGVVISIGGGGSSGSQAPKSHQL
jgi:hypothetical protein